MGCMQRPVVLRCRSPRLAVTSGLLSFLIAISGCGSGGGGSTGGGSDDGGSGGGVARAATWAKSYGGPAREQATAAAALADGGYIFGGIFNNRGFGGGRIFGFQGGGFDGDAWIVALDSLGDIRWQRTYGLRAATQPDSATIYLVVRPALDGAGTWLAGRVAATGPDSTYTERAFDLLITRLDGADQVRFSTAYDSGPFPFFPYFFSDEQQTSEAVDDNVGSTDLWPTNDGGAVVATAVEAFVLNEGRGEVARAVWVLKVNAAGEREWSTFVGADEFVGFNGAHGYGYATATPEATARTRYRSAPNRAAAPFSPTVSTRWTPVRRQRHARGAWTSCGWTRAISRSAGACVSGTPTSRTICWPSTPIAMVCSTVYW